MTTMRMTIEHQSFERILATFMVMVLLFATATCDANAQDTIRRHVIATGATTGATGIDVRLSGTVGQAIIGIVNDRSSINDAQGFWYGAVGSQISQTDEAERMRNGMTIIVAPNPFSSTTEFTLHSARSGWGRVRILDLCGGSVRTVWAGRLAEEIRELEWDGTDDAGNEVASGIYLYVVEAGQEESRLTVTASGWMVRAE